MYGRTMQFKVGEMTIRMRPFWNKEEFLTAREGHSSHEVLRLMDLPPFGKSEDQLMHKHESASESKTNIMWAIEHVEGKKVIGYTQFWDFRPIDRVAQSATMIWDKSYWGKKITSHVHLARTYYGVKLLNMIAMKSYVLTDNEASYRSLQNIGYNMFGTLWSYHFVDGEYKDSHHLVWYNPDEVKKLFPKGTPDVFKESFVKAKEAMERAEKIVSFK